MNHAELSRLIEEVFAGEKKDPDHHYDLYVNVKHPNPVDGDSESPPGKYKRNIYKYVEGEGYVETYHESERPEEEIAVFMSQ